MSGLQYQGKGNALSSMTLGNSTTQSFVMNDRLQMASQELKRGSEVLQKYDYGYGQIDTETGVIAANSNNGQLAKIESTIGTAKQWEQRFGYDSIGRLSESREHRGDTNALSYKQKFDYDRFGNLYRKASSNPTTGQATPIAFASIEEADISKPTNQFTTGTTYDEAGNVTQDAKFRLLNYSYDANGRMYKTTTISPANQSNAGYDASGNRVATQVDGVWTFFIYDAFGKKVAEYGGLQATDEGGVKYVLSDWQGSSRAIVSNSGYINARMDYTAFGEEIQSNIGQRTTAQGSGSSNTLDQKYALTERDKATGLDHTWFRKLENQAGRWTSPDPYNGSMSLGNPQSFNRYSYVGNEPTNYVDPTGLLMMVCTTYRRTWDDVDDNGNPRANVQEWSECRIVGGGGNIGTTITPQQPIDVGGGVGPVSSEPDDKLPFNSCSEFVDYLVNLAVNMSNQKHGGGKSKAKALGVKMMHTAYFEYDSHSKNGYAGFKNGLVNAGAEVGNPQGGNVYGHILAFAGAYLDGSNLATAAGATLANEYDHGQIIAGNNPQAPSEAAGNATGTRVGKHIWNYMTGITPKEDDRLKNSLTSELCK